jgi:hypothetical protein
MPAPVALLMHVWSGAHEMPLPQSLASGRMVGIAETLQHITATMNNAAFIGVGYVYCGLVMFIVCCVVFITICYFFIRA